MSASGDHSLAQSMRSLTIGTVKSMSAAQRQRDLEGLIEREDQFKINVSGRGEEFPAWTEVEIMFGVTFVDASGQRDSPYDRPHFTYGVEIEQGVPVALDACVIEWNVNDRNECVGCTLAIGPRSTDVARTFRGALHARFQGYGVPADPYGDTAMLDTE